MARPEPSTYETQMIPLMKELNNRDALGTKDNEYINVFFEIIQNQVTGEKDYLVIKRPGVIQLTASTGTGDLRGFYYWEYDHSIYYAVGSGLYKYDTSTAAITTINASYFSTSTGVVGFTEFLYIPGTSVLVITDGTTLSQIDQAGTVTTCVDADLPTPHQPYPVYLDGYLFLSKVNTGDMYNSDLNNPMTWTASNFITAEISPDTIVRIAKLSNYLVVFGVDSIEYFWDAGNATGSPLQRNDTPVKLNGFLGGFAQLGNKIYFIGNNNESEPCVYVIEDFKLSQVNSQILRKYLANSNIDLTTATSVIGNIVSVVGHDFYILNVDGQTFVLELEAGLLTKWAYQANGSFPITSTVNIKSTTGYKSIFSLSNDNKLYYFDLNTYQDNGVAYTWTIITDNQEFNTYSQKFMNRLTIWADKPPGSLSVNVSWTDDDYQNYSTPIALDLYQEMPSLHRLGRFRRRAFKLESTANQPMRMQKLEVNINKGVR